MAKRQGCKLSALQVTRETKAGLYGDGHGLYLQVSPTGSKSWVMKYTRFGVAREMGLGPLRLVSLAQAREQAVHWKRILHTGLDPLEQRNAERLRKQAEAVSGTTFEACAQQYITAHRSSWKSAKHAAQWAATLETYVYPQIGQKPVSLIDVSHVMVCLLPIWQTKPETANRVRGRIEKILDWARVNGFRQGENPARWRGHLDHSLPSRRSIQKVTHFAAIPYSQMGAVMRELTKLQTVSARALELLILTATRTSEALNATWQEFDLDNGAWTIPPERMKAGREHRIPLSVPAMRVLRLMHAARVNEFVFPGMRANKPLSNMTLSKVLRSIGFDGFTVHGFRSSFRDWAAETTEHSGEVIEMALAHSIRDKVESAYRRGDLFAKRKILMDDWAAYLMRGINLAPGYSTSSST